MNLLKHNNKITINKAKKKTTTTKITVNSLEANGRKLSQRLNTTLDYTQHPVPKR